MGADEEGGCYLLTDQIYIISIWMLAGGYGIAKQAREVLALRFKDGPSMSRSEGGDWDQGIL
jgi:hypothetical protein